MARSPYVKELLEKVQGGEPLVLKTMWHDGQEIVLLELSQQGDYLVVREIAEISGEEISYQTRRISIRRAKTLLSVYLTEQRK